MTAPQSIQMIDLKLSTSFIVWTGATFAAHYSVKRILVAAAPRGAEVKMPDLPKQIEEQITLVS